MNIKDEGFGAIGRAPMNGWLPIETAPKDGTVLLLCEADEDFVTIGHNQGDQFVVVDHGHHMNAGLIMAPTHWMPMPQVPQMPTGGDSATRRGGSRPQGASTQKEEEPNG